MLLYTLSSYFFFLFPQNFSIRFTFPQEKILEHTILCKYLIRFIYSYVILAMSVWPVFNNQWNSGAGVKIA